MPWLACACTLFVPLLLLLPCASACTGISVTVHGWREFTCKRRRGKKTDERTTSWFPAAMMPSHLWSFPSSLLAGGSCYTAHAPEAFPQALNISRKTLQPSYPRILSGNSLTYHARAAALLHHYRSTALRQHSITALQHYNTAALQQHSTTALQHCIITALQHYGNTVIQQ